MNFFFMIRQLNIGQLLRRKKWPEDCYLKKTNQKYIRLFSDFGSRPYSPTLIDIDADDWELKENGNA